MMIKTIMVCDQCGKEQDSQTAENWIDVTDDLRDKGYSVDPTPTGFVVEIHNTGKSELTVTFDIAPKPTIIMLVTSCEDAK